ncbi:MAG: tRNA epoxyqueuosine(34) reductase QueG [Deltaproteobacteria bacterium CG11_big_fil_rev_8_21_14_0_20_47_16]|nr:MAG: tRNA epoxyqueuosine(34) reductase QueG [Deltaproteobacteria bacterium CG11_big_fil_rev_8_21_14_0_20_47_16]
MSKELLKKASELGLQSVALTPIFDAPELARDLDTWLAEGLQGEMLWMTRDPARRADPRKVLAGAKTLISCTLNYYTLHTQTNNARNGRISRYAWGDDYHDVFLPKLKQLAEWIVAENPDAECLAYVDTGPVMEKPWAVRAGLGWQGKHTNLIDSKRGSWFFIGEIITTASLGGTEWGPHFRQQAESRDISSSAHTEGDADKWGDSVTGPREAVVSTGSCGTCTRCIDACPTRAIMAPYKLDPRKCISYLTIEHKGSIPLEMRPLMGNHIYGCDICQDVCPWNRFATPTPEAAFEPRKGNLNPELMPLMYMSDDEFRARFKNSPIKRIKRARFLRNVAVALGNSKDPAAIPALQHAVEDPEPLIREHAEWALQQVLAANEKVR